MHFPYSKNSAAQQLVGKEDEIYNTLMFNSSKSLHDGKLLHGLQFSP